MDLTWSGDGTHLAAICKAGEFCCWQVQDNSLVECIRGSVEALAYNRAGLALSNDGSVLYVAGDRGPDGFHVWDVLAQAKLDFVSSLYAVRRLLVSPDDRLLIAASDGVFVFDRETLSLLHHLQIGGECTSLGFAPDGRTLVAGYQDSAIRLWDPEQATLKRVLPEYGREDGDTLSLLFSHDGRTLLAGDYNGRLRFWNTETWGYLGAMRVFKDNGYHQIRALALPPEPDSIDMAYGHYSTGLRRFARIPLKSDDRLGLPNKLNVSQKIAWNENVVSDFGDAPAPYPTTAADDGARHAVAGPTLGDNRDWESDGRPTATADADDTMGSPDDEDGVTFGTLMVGALEATVAVEVQGRAGKLDAWRRRFELL